MSGELVGGFSVADILAKRKVPSLSCLKLLSNLLCRRWKWGRCHAVLVTLPEPYKEKDYRLELVGKGGVHVSTMTHFIPGSWSVQGMLGHSRGYRGCSQQGSG